ncbi:MAG: HAD family hydrolase [Haloarculaceae archaeon]
MDAVCFDMDGVLVDSEDYWVPYEREGLLPMVGLPDLDIDELTGRNYRDIYDYLVEEYDVETEREAVLDWFDETAERIYGEDAALLPGAQELVDDLRDRGVAVAVVSSSPHHWIDIVVERFDLDVDAVVSAEDVDGPGKPHPAVFEYAAAELGADPGETVAIEDSLHGIESANRAGMYVVGFKHGDDQNDRSDADYVASSPDDLRDHLLARVGE